MNIRSFMYYLQKYLPWLLLTMIIVGVDLVFSCAPSIQSSQWLSWFVNNSIGWGLLTLGLTGLLVYGFQTYFSKAQSVGNTPAIKVIVQGGQSILIHLTEKNILVKATGPARQRKPTAKCISWLYVRKPIHNPLLTIR